jgi:hypothetical protein
MIFSGSRRFRVLFHVNQCPCDHRHVTAIVSRESFPDTEGRKQSVQHHLRVDPTEQSLKSHACKPEVFSRDLGGLKARISGAHLGQSSAQP